MSEPTINETDEPVDPVSAVDYWRDRWSASASAHVDALAVADTLADRLRSANAVIERMAAAQFNPAILDRIREALDEHRNLIGLPLRRVLDAEWCKEEHCWVRSAAPEHKHTESGVLSRAFVMGVRFAAEQMGAISNAE